MTSTIRIIIAIAVIAVLPLVAQAGTVYTDPAVFQAALSSYYLESFDGIALGDIAAPISYSSGGYSYSVSAVGPSGSGLWGQFAPGSSTDKVLSTSSSAGSLVVTFTSGNITAVGGYFFPTANGGGLLPGAVTVTLSDGTVINLTSPGVETFTGYGSSGAVLTSLTIDALDTTTVRWPTVNNLYVGAAAPDNGVPEPATTALVGIGALLLAWGVRGQRT